MATFEPTTAYAHTGRYYPGYAEALLRKTSASKATIEQPAHAIVVVRGDTSVAEWRNFSSAFMASNQAAGFYGFRDGSPNMPDPELDDELRILEGDDEGYWVIKGVVRVRWGPDWFLPCVKDDGR